MNPLEGLFGAMVILCVLVLLAGIAAGILGMYLYNHMSCGVSVGWH